MFWVGSVLLCSVCIAGFYLVQEVKSHMFEAVIQCSFLKLFIHLRCVGVCVFSCDLIFLG